MCLNEKFLFEVYGSGEPAKTPEELAEAAKRISEDISYYNKTATHPNGMYEILHQGNPYAGEEGETELIHSIQGAEVKYTPGQGNHFSVKVNWKNNRPETEIENIGICIHETDEEIKLGHIFSTTPWGIIKKNRTGVGATTLEINAERNSIIVVPTKTLAYTKYMTGWDEITGKNKYCYVGSPIGECTQDTRQAIQRYLQDNDIKYKKFLVVADSFPTLIEEIGESVYKDYFLMIDEIDTYQDDSTFRPALPDAIDYYFRFNPYNRCLVSATIKEFSHPQVNQEPVIELEYPPVPMLTVKLIHGQNVTAIVKEQIEAIPAGEKVLIAYNKVQSILEIIGMLPEDLQQQCAILCGPASRTNAERYYIETIERHLPKRINFITCTYFVGVDINERYHLISVSDTTYPYTVLSPDKMIQIRGRCRSNEGVLSETIVYNTKYERNPPDIAQIKRGYLEFARDMASYINGIDEMKKKYPQFNTSSFKNVKKAVSESAQIKLLSGNSLIKIIRVNMDGVCEINYFPIDSICEGFYVIKHLYNQPQTLRGKMQGEGYTVHFEERDIPITEEQQGIRDNVAEQYEDNDHNTVERVIAKLQKLNEAGELDDRNIRQIEIELQDRGAGKAFLERFKKLRAYMPFEELITALQSIPARDTTQVFKKLVNNVIFYCLTENNPFKASLKASFPIGHIATPEEISRGMTTAFVPLILERLLHPTSSIRYLGLLFDIRRVRSQKRAYKIVNHNKMGFTWTPLKRIETNEELKELFEIIWR